jgi:hypothetical protein
MDRMIAKEREKMAWALVVQRIIIGSLFGA